MSEDESPYVKISVCGDRVIQSILNLFAVAPFGHPTITVNPLRVISYTPMSNIIPTPGLLLSPPRLTKT